MAGRNKYLVSVYFAQIEHKDTHLVPVVTCFLAVVLWAV